MNRRHHHQSLLSSLVKLRSGFTLVELMMVIGLVLLIAVMTASAINLSVSGDKVRGGARQVQSYLAGARDRAIYSKAPRGVRFLLDSTNNRTVSSMVYIAPTDDWTQGNIQVEWDTTVSPPLARIIRGFDNSSSIINPTGWLGLYQQGLLKDGLRIRIPNDNTGEWYSIDTSLMAICSPDQSDGPNAPRLRLTTAYAHTGTTDPTMTIPAFSPGQGPTTYRLELPASVLANQEPVLLPKGCVIHMDRCSTNPEQFNAGTPAVGRGNKLPSGWRKPTTTGDSSGFDYTSQMDVMFSPRGVVIGPAAQTGIVHFYLGDQKDADLDRLYWSSASSFPTSSAPEYGTWADAMSPGYERGDKLIMTLFTRTGAVSTHPIHPTDTFKFAETGEVAGK
ncbi:MAG: prepilin-type N-terminal cleavage/methylation domain-containing protein [Planctomycetota bacterium]